MEKKRDFKVYKKFTKEEGNSYWYYHNNNFLTRMDDNRLKELSDDCPDIECVFNKHFGDDLNIIICDYNELDN